MSNGIVVMVCVAQAGFHPYVVYEWKRSRVIICNWPVTYVDGPGTYTCTIRGANIFAKRVYIPC